MENKKEIVKIPLAVFEESENIFVIPVLEEGLKKGTCFYEPMSRLCVLDLTSNTMQLLFNVIHKEQDEKKKKLKAEGPECGHLNKKRDNK